MYRVELKVCGLCFEYNSLVPNVPCGVERPLPVEAEKLSFWVHNVPCGVESLRALDE